MAKENSIILIGKVVGNPTATHFKDTDTYKVGWRMEVLRRSQRRDTPHIVIYGLSEKSAHQIFDNLARNKDSFVMVRGMISTSLDQEKVLCPNCGSVKSISILHTNIIAFAPPIFLKGDYDFEELKEFANNANIIGTVCSKPFARSSTNGTAMAQFQIAVNRKFRVVEQGDTVDDYPWIKTFSKVADESLEHLKVGSQIYISGAIQTRDVVRKTLCDECKSELQYPETVSEIVPYDIEYLTNCVFEHDDNEENKEEKESNTNQETDKTE